jgi:hypothetical protein
VILSSVANAEQAGSLDNIGRRYSWFNRMMKTYDVEHASIFPTYWRVNEMLANSFCEGTREDFKSILQKSVRRGDGPTLDVDLLLSCLQETLNFEHSLERRFANEVCNTFRRRTDHAYHVQSRSSIDTVDTKEDRSHGFSQAISEAFEPYMSLWVESQDRYVVPYLLVIASLIIQATGQPHTQVPTATPTKS